MLDDCERRHAAAVQVKVLLDRSRRVMHEDRFLVIVGEQLSGVALIVV